MIVILLFVIAFLIMGLVVISHDSTSIITLILSLMLLLASFDLGRRASDIVIFNTIKSIGHYEIYRKIDGEEYKISIKAEKVEHIQSVEPSETKLEK